MTTGDNSKVLWEWAFLTSLVAIVGLAGIFIPPLYFFTAVFLPLPLILLIMKLDLRYAVAGLGAAGLFLLAVAPQPIAVLILILHYGLLGILYGLLFKNQVSSGKSLGVGLIGAAVLALFTLGLIYVLTGENPFVLGPESHRIADEWLAANRDAGAFDDMPPDWAESFGQNMLTLFELFLPGQFIVASSFSSILTFFLARVTLSRLNFSLPPAPAFSQMSLPWYSIWALITGLGLTLAGDQFSLFWAAKAGKNILFILLYVYLTLGLSVVVYLYRRLKLARPLKIIIFISAVIYFPFSTILILLLGVADPLINFRRLPASKE